MYLLGQILMLVGFLTFASVFLTSAMNFGNFENFENRTRSTALRAFAGMAMLMAGGVLLGVGRAGLAGSGVVLDPEQAREDLEPWSRMTGGMVKDAIEESGIALGQQSGVDSGFAEKMRPLHALFEEGILSEEEYQQKKAELLKRY